MTVIEKHEAPVTQRQIARKPKHRGTARPFDPLTSVALAMPGRHVRKGPQPVRITR